MQKKILLGDETGALQETLKGIFEKEGRLVFCASSAEEVYDLHLREKADVIIANLNLPMMGGDDLCSLIREEQDLKRVYFMIVCSGMRGDLERCGRCGASSYIRNPFSPERVVDGVNRVLSVTELRATRVLVKAKVNGTFRSEHFYSVSNNVSVTGMLIDTDKTLAKGDSISCSFFLPDSDRVEASGTVVRVSKGNGQCKYLCGIRFDELDTEQKEMIDKFVRKQRNMGNFI